MLYHVLLGSSVIHREREREQNSKSVKGNCLERCSDIDIVARRSMTCYVISACWLVSNQRPSNIFQLILAVQGSGTLPHRASGINIRACWDEGEKINGLSRLSSKKKIFQSFTFLCNTVTLSHAVSIFWANMFLQETSTESLPRLDQYVIHCYSITSILFECPS